MLFSLSLRNIKKSMKDYSIYFMTLVFAVAIFYVFNSLDAQTSMMKLSAYKNDMIKSLVDIISYISIFVSFILGFLIIYANNFLIRRRKKEIGLYFTLGISKRKVSTLLVIETILIGVISLVVGLLVGIGLSQFLSIITASLFEADMSKFEFVFSSASLMKTIAYFGVIYFLVMIFNIITLSRYKLIDLLNANKKNEKVKIRNKYITFITLILSIISIGYAYHLLFDGALYELGNNTLIMLTSGSLGTFLLFLSLSGFLLRIIEMNKKVYYKGLNMFVLKQINNKINTTVISTTIISLMLLLTIGILSSSMSLVNAFNGDLKNNNLTDFTIKTGYSISVENGDSVYEESSEQINNTKLEFDNFINSDEYKKYVKEYSRYKIYYSPDLIVGDLIEKETQEKINNEFEGQVNFDYRVPVMSETDYNNLMKLYNKEQLVINLKEDEYLLLANVEQVLDYYKEGDSKKQITINDKTLSLVKNGITNISLENYNGAGNTGTVVLDDEVIKGLNPEEEVVCGNYLELNDTNDMAFATIVERVMNTTDIYYMRSKLAMEAAATGIKVIVTFIGMYLGIIFAITSATVLAIGQLSESSDNKARYKVLRQIGADNKMIRRSLFTQIGICFMLPLVVALFHAYFGLGELNKMIKLFGNLDLAGNILVTTIFIVVVYGGYFIATYICSKNIIEE